MIAPKSISQRGASNHVLGAQRSKSTQNDTIQGEIGLGGGDGGMNPWTFTPNGRITGIRIASGVVVDSIRFTYEDDDNKKHHSATYGGDGGACHTIDFDRDEYVIGVNGTIGQFENTTVIKSLSFDTNKKMTYGPYGTDEGIRFSFTQGKVIGFYGSYADYLNSIGVIFKA